MLDITSTISSDNKTVTIVFITSVNTSVGTVTDSLDDSIIDYEVIDSSSIRFIVSKDSDYKLTFQLPVGEDEGAIAEYDSVYLLVNSRSLIYGNKKNKRDIDSSLKNKKPEYTSKLADCLNRLVIGNHRLGKYKRASEILLVIENYCEGDCEC